MSKGKLNLSLSTIFLIKLGYGLVIGLMLMHNTSSISIKKSKSFLKNDNEDCFYIDFQSNVPLKVSWTDTVNVFISNKSLITKSVYNSARSTQIIPASSNGYVQCEWSILSRAKERGWKFGLISVNDPLTVGNIKMTVNFLSNTNTDIYEGVNYSGTISGGTSIQADGVLHRWRVDRLTQKIYYETSNNSKSWTLRATYSKKVIGDLRAGFYGNEAAKEVLNATIQADEGLVF
jgi:hypothetical protein